MKKSIIRKLSTSVKLIILLDVFFAVILTIFTLFLGITENIYSRGIYPVFAFMFGKFTDMIFFSITELFAFVMIFIFIIRMIIGIWQIIVKKLKFKAALIHFIKQSFIVLSLIVIWFYFSWGFNYFRMPFKIDAKSEEQITDEYFNKVLDQIINKSNSLYMKRNITLNAVNDKVNAGLSETMQEISELKISTAKKYKFSFIKILDSMNILGMISPFFLESHIANELIDCEIPSLLAHEKVHLFGYGNEAEVNLLAFLTCIGSDDKYFQYSGYCEVLPFFLSVYRRNHTKNEYMTIYNKLRPEIKEEFEKMHKRFVKHDSAVNKFLNSAYDLYLKINNVKEGTGAYSQVVELILKNRIIELYER